LLCDRRDDLEKVKVIMDKPRRRRTHNIMPSVALDVLPATLTNRDIARRAYELYEKRGRAHGHDLEDRLQAERELQDALRSAAACYPREMPDLRLTLEQVQRLCAIERTICQIVLNTLVETQFLCVTTAGAYTRPTGGVESARPLPIKAIPRSDTSTKKAS
jgi:hypothetical protein